MSLERLNKCSLDGAGSERGPVRDCTGVVNLLHQKTHGVAATMPELSFIEYDQLTIILVDWEMETLKSDPRI